MNRMSLAMGALALSVFTFAVIARDEARSCCGDTEETQSAHQSKGDYASPPCGCPLWVMYTLGGNNLYYCERFQTDCEEEPDVTSIYGQYNLSPGCDTNCIPAKRKHILKALSPFPGIDPILMTDSYLLPDGPDRQFSAIMEDPSLRYIKFQISGADRYAKVFTYMLDLRGRYCSQEHRRIVHLATELKNSEVPPSFINVGQVTPIDAYCVANGTPALCRVFRAIHRPAGAGPTQPGTPVQISVLTKK
jgi:hypothetical protein